MPSRLGSGKKDEEEHGAACLLDSIRILAPGRLGHGDICWDACPGPMAASLGRLVRLRPKPFGSCSWFLAAKTHGRRIEFTSNSRKAG